jgi:hypothetical protein
MNIVQAPNKQTPRDAPDRLAGQAENCTDCTCRPNALTLIYVN